METDVAVGTADEQLGSPAWTFEKGWLAGVVLGLLGMLLLARRRARRRAANRAAEAE